jgi:hypothetical protein
LARFTILLPVKGPPRRSTLICSARPTLQELIRSCVFQMPWASRRRSELDRGVPLDCAKSGAASTWRKCRTRRRGQ